MHDATVSKADSALLPPVEEALSVDQFPVGFNALLVKSIQELAANNDNLHGKLKAANDNQNREIDELRQEIQALKAARQ